MTLRRTGRTGGYYISPLCPSACPTGQKRTADKMSATEEFVDELVTKTDGTL
jgi:hypothetical protein